MFLLCHMKPLDLMYTMLMLPQAYTDKFCSFQKVKSLHTDISTVTGERVIIFILENSALFDNGEKK